MHSSCKEELRIGIERCESAINAVRSDVSDKVLNRTGDAAAVLSGPLQSNPKTDLPQETDVRLQLEKINSFIAEVDDQTRRQRYSQALANLTASSSYKDVYYYVELYDEMKEDDHTVRRRMEIQKTINGLRLKPLYAGLKNEREKLMQFGISLIENDRIKAHAFEDFQAQCTVFEEQNEKMLLAESIKEKERLFLKTQLIKCLEGLHYDVMDDMEVVDFEKESDFLLKIPNQSNYLNLRFQKDGSFLYNFLIPQAKEELSIDQKREKLSDMETTCNEFKDLLKDLKGMGLKIDLNSEKPISESALMQVPSKYRSRIRTAKASREKNGTQKRRTLN
jgi:hypothetical protein